MVGPEQDMPWLGQNKLCHGWAGTSYAMVGPGKVMPWLGHGWAVKVRATVGPEQDIGLEQVMP